jgi:hypothetical protein
LAEASVNLFTTPIFGPRESQYDGLHTHPSIETMRDAVMRLEKPSNKSDFATSLSQTSGEEKMDALYLLPICAFLQINSLQNNCKASVKSISAFFHPTKQFDVCQSLALEFANLCNY